MNKCCVGSDGHKGGGRQAPTRFISGLTGNDMQWAFTLTSMGMMGKVLGGTSCKNDLIALLRTGSFPFVAIGPGVGLCANVYLVNVA